MPTIFNWATTYSCEPREVLSPRDDEAVVAILQRAKQDGLKVRVIGARHTPGDLFCVDYGGLLLKTDELDKVYHVDEAAATVEVGAGMRLYRLNTVLEEHGLAATILPDISEQSIAGTISTSTHGFGLNFGTFSAYVLSLTIALADGTVVTYSRMERPKLFFASLCGLGLTGVILRVKLQCESKFSVRAVTDVKYNLRDFLKGFQSELESAEHVAMMWWPEEDAVTLKKGDRTNEPTQPAPPASRLGWLVHRWSLFKEEVTCYIATFYPSRWLSAASLYHSRFLQVATNAGKQRGLHSVAFFNGPNDIRQRTYEGSVPLENAAACLLDIQAWLDEEREKPDGWRCVLPLGIRVCDKDDIWLSPAYERKSVYIGATLLLPFGRDVPHVAFYTKLEEILAKHGSRPHWGKRHTYTLEQLRALYPKLDDFQAVRREVDQDGMFVNEYARRHFELA